MKKRKEVWREKKPKEKNHKIQKTDKKKKTRNEKIWNTKVKKNDKTRKIFKEKKPLPKIYTQISKRRKKNIRHRIIAINYSTATQIMNENELQSELLSKCRREGRMEGGKKRKGEITDFLSFPFFDDCLSIESFLLKLKVLKKGRLIWVKGTTLWLVYVKGTTTASLGYLIRAKIYWSQTLKMKFMICYWKFWKRCKKSRFLAKGTETNDLNKQKIKEKKRKKH